MDWQRDIERNALRDHERHDKALRAVVASQLASGAITQEQAAEKLRKLDAEVEMFAKLRETLNGSGR